MEHIKERRMKICVVGSVMYDEIFPYQGERKESFGGVLYNILALARVFGRDATIHPVTRLGADHLPVVIERYLHGLPSVHLQGIRINPEGTNQNTLRYPSPDRREERMTLRTPPVTLAELSPFLNADIVLINFISCLEIGLETMQQMRRHSRAFVFLDVHNLPRFVDAEGHLRPKPLESWEEWVGCVNCLQCNEEELCLLLNQQLNSEDEYQEALLQIVGAGPSYAVLTLGSRGSMLVYKSGGACYGLRVPVPPVERMVDSTGCGDAFSAGFLKGLFILQHPLKALLLATAVAAINCEAAGLDGCSNVHEAEPRMKAAYPDVLRHIDAGWSGELLRPATA
jgi:sugar/nucleoside kinase (ribokinase family)